MKTKAEVVIFFLGISLFSCTQEMGKSGHLRPLEGGQVGPMLTGSPPEGTVAQSEKTAAFNQNSFKLTRAFLERGREQYQISCVPCHGPSGYGDGMIVQRGFLAPPSYHIARLRQASDTHFFDVMTHGYGAMYSYADRVSEPDRWAVVAYIRALQLSQNVSWDDLSADDRQKLETAVHK